MTTMVIQMAEEGHTEDSESFKSRCIALLAKAEDSTTDGAEKDMFAAIRHSIQLKGCPIED